MAQTRGMSKDEVMETKILSTLPTPPVPLMRSHDKVAPYTLSNDGFYPGYRSCGVQLTSTCTQLVYTNCFTVNPNPTACEKALVWPKWGLGELPKKRQVRCVERISFITCNKSSSHHISTVPIQSLNPFFLSQNLEFHSTESVTYQPVNMFELPDAKR